MVQKVTFHGWRSEDNYVVGLVDLTRPDAPEFPNVPFDTVTFDNGEPAEFICVVHWVGGEPPMIAMLMMMDDLISRAEEYLLDKSLDDALS